MEPNKTEKIKELIKRGEPFRMEFPSDYAKGEEILYMGVKCKITAKGDYRTESKKIDYQLTPLK